MVETERHDACAGAQNPFRPIAAADSAWQQGCGATL
jgi:hypothetical protein